MVKKNNKLLKYRRRGFNFWKSIYNYHATKLSVSSLLEYTGNTCKFKISTQSYMNIPDTLSASPDFKNYANIFNSFKLRAIKITISPHTSPTPFLGGTVQVGVLTSPDQSTFGDVVESNKSCIASYLNRSVLYVSFGNGSTGWIGCQRVGDIPGKIVAAQSEAYKTLLFK